MTLKTAVLAPIPSASVRTVIAVKPGIRARPRRSWLNRIWIDTVAVPDGFPAGPRWGQVGVPAGVRSGSDRGQVGVGSGSGRGRTGVRPHIDVRFCTFQ